ncbi:dephospho-CoA kinase [Belliella buryatensis]|uniref:Dephospho-CoA kinase n=1 Tax=Belliella buryatensis TaxID=1500549 RepID=A0A239E1D2_9BACT|nr:dephospho-CoA kinase [Belliella buryatensis]SNS38496.1 dephospho-CoA kinase [Belliella buryatensis]
MNKNRTLLVGITGGIGSGKSIVAKIFSILNIPVYYADDRAKWLLSNNAGLKTKIMEVFGEKSYFDNGDLNRAFLASEVFGNIEKTQLINSLVHPVVKVDFEAWAEENQKSPYVLKEAALLFETGSAEELDFVITVSSPLRVRINRILLRDPHRTEYQVNAIIDQQLPDEEKIKKSDFVVKNVDNKLLIPQVLEIHQKILDTLKK